MKRLINLSVALLLGVSAFADDYSLYYQSVTDDKNEKIEAVEKIQKVIFEDGVVKVVFTDATTKEIQASLVQRLFFFTESGLVAIDQVKADNSKVDDAAEIYDLMGRKVNAKVSELPKGLYIVNGKKVLKK